MPEEPASVWSWLGPIVAQAGPVALVVFLVLVALLKFVLPRLIEGTISKRFAKELEVHRHQLEMAGDAARHDLERRMRGFAHFVERKHSTYAELYGKLREALGTKIPELLLAVRNQMREELAQ